MMPERNKRPKRARGQNLVEMALTFPLLLVLMFFTIEMGRAWYTYQGAMMAANEGAHTASVYQSPAIGKSQCIKKLQAANLNVKGTPIITQVPNKHAYQAEVTVTFKPFFGSVSIPTLSGPISLIPASFDITYTAIKDTAVY